MIIVTGTKRTGTSMWMQILSAAGYRVLGERFPRDWGRTIRAANERGFFESSLRHGVVEAQARDPDTGTLLRPDETRDVAVKVFAAGLARTHRSHLRCVIASVRHVREYQRSLERLYAMEQASKLERATRRGRSSEVLPSRAQPSPALEWWNDNYTIIEDARQRGYPLRLVSYEAVLRDPRSEVLRALDWLGRGEAQADAAVEAVQRALRTQEREVGELLTMGVEREHQAVFEELYARVDHGRAFDAAFVREMARVHEQLAPRIAVEMRQVKELRRQARERARRALRTR